MNENRGEDEPAMKANAQAMVLNAAAPRRAVEASEPSRRPADSSASDAEIVAETLRGCAERFELLVLRYEGPIYHYLHRLVRSREDAEDLTQETFVRAMTGLATFDLRRPFRPWLYRIATNLAVSLLRRRRPGFSLDDEPQRLPPAAVAAARQREEIARSEEEKLLEGAIERLTPLTRAVVELRYREEMTLEEIGEALGRKPNAVAVALHRGRERLREILFPPDGVEEYSANDSGGER